MPRHSAWHLALLASSGFFSHTFAACYKLDGTIVTDDRFQPCNNVNGGMCCGLRHQENNDIGLVNDKCDPTGLCQNMWPINSTSDHTPQRVFYWRDYCTDPTWKHPSCLKDVCADAKFADFSDNAPLQPCGDGTFCCAFLNGKENFDCCKTATSVFKLAATIGATTSSSSTTVIPITSSSDSANLLTTTSSRAPTSPAAASTAPNTNDQKGSRITPSAAVGLGVGVAIGVLAVAAAALLLFRWHKTRRQKVPEKFQYTPPPAYGYQGPPLELEGRYLPVDTGGTARSELHGSMTVSPTARQSSGLPTSS